MHIGKPGCVGFVSNAQRGDRCGHDPQASGAVLKHNGGAGLIVGDGSMHPDPRRHVLQVIAREDLIHGRQR